MFPDSNVNILGVGSGEMISNIVNYEPIVGNPIWRFLAVLVAIIIATATSKIVQFMLTNLASLREKKVGKDVISIFLRCVSTPVSLALLGIGLSISRFFMHFGENGISDMILTGWKRVSGTIIAVSVAYAIYKMVDIIEYYLIRWTGKTDTKLDDMLVPVVRKSLRITIAIFSAIYIIDNILDQNVQSILVSAGVGGIAIALAAKDSIANFFGSVTIFADRPFQVDEMISIEGYTGPVEEVGFRSTKIRTLYGHLVTIPNNTIANSIIENISSRPFIRRTSNITIAYDSGHNGAKRAVEIIKEILADVSEINTDQEKPPRVYFSDFNDWSLNIYMSYWVKPPNYWLYQQVNEQVNLEMTRRFEAEGIEFAFPTQTLYMKNE